MAEPILFKLPPRDPREALYQRLENVPKEHVEALLAVCDILQGLYDRGILELANLMMPGTALLPSTLGGNPAGASSRL